MDFLTFPIRHTNPTGIHNIMKTLHYNLRVSPPDVVGIVLSTLVGLLVHAGRFRLQPTGEETIGRAGKQTRFVQSRGFYSCSTSGCVKSLVWFLKIRKSSFTDSP